LLGKLAVMANQLDNLMAIGAQQRTLLLERLIFPTPLLVVAMAQEHLHDKALGSAIVANNVLGNHDKLKK